MSRPRIAAPGTNLHVALCNADRAAGRHDPAAAGLGALEERVLVCVVPFAIFVQCRATCRIAPDLLCNVGQPA